MSFMKKIYLAGPLFSEHERKYLEEMAEKIASNLGLDSNRDIFLPHRDAGDVGVHEKDRTDIFSLDVTFLDEASIVIALLDGSDVDSGTAVEMGYAYAQEKKVFGILTDWRRWNSESGVENINNMIWGVCGKGERIYNTLNEDFFQDLKDELDRI